MSKPRLYVRETRQGVRTIERAEGRWSAPQAPPRASKRGRLALAALLAVTGVPGGVVAWVILSHLVRMLRQ